MAEFDPAAGMEMSEAKPELLDPKQQRDLLGIAMQSLARISSLEATLADRASQYGSALAAFQEVRAELGQEVATARKAWQAEQGANAVTGSLAGGPFVHTLGTAPGAIAQGDEILALQRLLHKEGMSVPLTGHYDASTAQAVRRLQERHGLPSRGAVVGAATRRLLNRLAAGRLGDNGT